MIFLVVAFHTTITYSHIGAFLPLVMWAGFLEHGLATYLGGWHWQSAERQHYYLLSPVRQL